MLRVVNRSVPGDTHVGEARRTPHYYNKWRYLRRNLLPTSRLRPVMVGKSPSHTGTSSVLTVESSHSCTSRFDSHRREPRLAIFPARLARAVPRISSSHPPLGFSFRKQNGHRAVPLKPPSPYPCTIPFRALSKGNGTRSLAREREKSPLVRLFVLSRPSRQRFRSEIRNSAGSLDIAK